MPSWSETTVNDDDVDDYDYDYYGDYCNNVDSYNWTKQNYYSNHQYEY